MTKFVHSWPFMIFRSGLNLEPQTLNLEPRTSNFERAGVIAFSTPRGEFL